MEDLQAAAKSLDQADRKRLAEILSGPDGDAGSGGDGFTPQKLLGMTADDWVACDQDKLRAAMKAVSPDENTQITLNLRKLTAAQQTAYEEAGKAQEVIARAAHDAVEALQPLTLLPRAQKYTELLQHTPLIDLGYVIRLVEGGGVAPRRQDVPDSALITESTQWRIWNNFQGMFDEGDAGTSWNRDFESSPMEGVLVLSYPWLDWWHPDRCGAQLKRLLPALKIMFDHQFGRRPCIRSQAFADIKGNDVAARLDQIADHNTLGLMVDYICLPQKPFSSPIEKDTFIKSLTNINEWYFSSDSLVLAVTLPPPAGAIYSSTRLHADRGWCHFEKIAAMSVKGGTYYLDFGLWDDKVKEFGKHSSCTDEDTSILGKLKGSRQAPLSPVEFESGMREAVGTGRLAFTANADMDVVTEQYRIGFAKGFEEFSKDGPPRMSFTHPWEDDQGQVLLEALKYASKHCNLKRAIGVNVYGNKFSDKVRDAFEAADKKEFKGKFKMKYLWGERFETTAFRNMMLGIEGDCEEECEEDCGE